MKILTKMNLPESVWESFSAIRFNKKIPTTELLFNKHLLFNHLSKRGTNNKYKTRNYNSDINNML